VPLAAKCKCADVIPNSEVAYDVILICIFLSIFLLPAWRGLKEWQDAQWVSGDELDRAKNEKSENGHTSHNTHAQHDVCIVEEWGGGGVELSNTNPIRRRDSDDDDIYL
jgi:hypothetical protein